MCGARGFASAVPLTCACVDERVLCHRESTSFSHKDSSVLSEFISRRLRTRSFSKGVGVAPVSTLPPPGQGLTCQNPVSDAIPPKACGHRPGRALCRLPSPFLHCLSLALHLSGRRPAGSCFPAGRHSPCSRGAGVRDAGTERKPQFLSHTWACRGSSPWRQGPTDRRRYPSHSRFYIWMEIKAGSPRLCFRRIGSKQRQRRSAVAPSRALVPCCLDCTEGRDVSTR